MDDERISLRDFIILHPTANAQKVADVYGCSAGNVYRVKREIEADGMKIKVHVRSMDDAKWVASEAKRHKKTPAEIIALIITDARIDDEEAQANDA